MKKFLSLVVFCFFVSISAQMEFGIKAGYNLSQMKMDSSSENTKFDSKSYFYAGVLAEYPFNEKFSLQGELLYTQIGGKYKEEVFSFENGQVLFIGTAHNELKSSQILVPISLKYYFIPKFSISGGLNFGFNISGKFETDFNWEGYIKSGESKFFKSLAIYPFLGTEYKITDQIFVDARYHLGVFNSAGSLSPETKISFFQAGLGYRFK